MDNGKGFLVLSTRQRATFKIKIGKFEILTNLAVAVLSPVDYKPGFVLT